MRCGRCGFHNLPGLTVCMKCGSVLVAEAPVDVNPPRAGWTKPFRPIGYHFNRWLGFSLPTWFQSILGRVLPKEFVETFSPVHMVLSVIPGLGHLVLGHLYQVRYILAGWLVSLLAGLFLYGSLTGGFLLGLGIALHAWIIADSGKMWNLFPRITTRLLISVVMVFLLIMGVYNPIRNQAGKYVRGAIPGAPIPTDGIERTDFVLINMHAYDKALPQRGDVVLGVVPRQDTHHGFYGVLRWAGGEVLAKVIALPGERVEFWKGTVRCLRGDQVLATYQVFDELLHGIDGSIEVPQDAYYCLMNISLYAGHGMVPGQLPAGTHQLLLEMGLFSRESIRGRVFMIYNPLGRRGFLPRANVTGGNTPAQ